LLPPRVAVTTPKREIGATQPDAIATVSPPLLPGACLGGVVPGYIGVDPRNAILEIVRMFHAAEFYLDLAAGFGFQNSGSAAIQSFAGIPQ
jgi:hypothetical protein